MRKVYNLYSHVLSLSNILNIYQQQIKKNTKNKVKLAKFEEYIMCNIADIQTGFLSVNIHFHKYYIFLIQEPKYRIIMSQTIHDKLINHLIAQYFLLDVFEPSFIDSNIATRIGKGTHYGIHLTKKYLYELRKEEKEIYYLKCDISKYFYSIDHNVLKEKLKNKIGDTRVLDVLYKVIDSTNYNYISENISRLKHNEIDRISPFSISEKEKRIKCKKINEIPDFKKRGVGIPIGNMSSQAFALIYLNDLDHYIKEQLKIKHYIRYMDDFVLFSTDKAYLKKCLLEIEKKVTEEYHLQLNPKTKISPMKNGLDFLGFRFIMKDGTLFLKLRTSTKKKMKRKIRKMDKLYQNQQISYQDIRQVLASYQGHIRYGNTYYLRKKIFFYQCHYYSEYIGKQVTIQHHGKICYL